MTSSHVQYNKNISIYEKITTLIKHVRLVYPKENKISEQVIEKKQLTISIYEKLEILFKHNLSIPVVDRSLDTVKIKEYSKSFNNPKDMNIFNLIIKNTLYITNEQFIKDLRDIVKKSNIPDKVNLLFDTTIGFKSEHYATLIVWDLIKHKTVKIISSFTEVDNNLPILIIDDAMYSGTHIMGLIDEGRCDYKQRNRKSMNNTVIVIVPYRIKGSTNQIKSDPDIFGNVKIYENSLISSFLELYETKLDIDENYMYEHFGCETKSVACIYFDHKIANKFGTFTDIYTNTIKAKTSRSKIEELSNIYMSL